jgi:hypothetical protein
MFMQKANERKYYHEDAFKIEILPLLKIDDVATDCVRACVRARARFAKYETAVTRTPRAQKSRIGVKCCNHMRTVNVL